MIWVRQPACLCCLGSEPYTLTYIVDPLHHFTDRLYGRYSLNAGPPHYAFGLYTLPANTDKSRASALFPCGTLSRTLQHVASVYTAGRITVHKLRVWTQFVYKRTGRISHCARWTAPTGCVQPYTSLNNTILLLLLLYLPLLPCSVGSPVHFLKATLSRASLFKSTNVFPFLLSTSIAQSSQVLPLPLLFSLLASVACFGFL